MAAKFKLGLQVDAKRSLTESRASNGMLFYIAVRCNGMLFYIAVRSF